MIGILDSGIGGLIVARKIIDRFPYHDIVYYGDTARTPYGNKTAEAIIRYALENTEALVKQGAKLIVIASHTVSGAAGQQIKEKFNIPVLEIITPAVKLALDISHKRMIGVMGSRSAIDGNIYQKEILKFSPDAKVYSVACPLLVPLVEENWLKRPETVMIVKKYLLPLKVRQIDTLVLACNHMTVLKKTIQKKIGKRVNIVDPTDAIAEGLNDFINNNSGFEKMFTKRGNRQFFVSDLSANWLTVAKIIFKRNILLEYLRP